MREIGAQQVSAAIARLCWEANTLLGEDVVAALQRAEADEPSPVGRAVLAQILKNAQVARAERLPLCQDTGIAVVFADVGQDVQLVGGDLRSAIEAGVAQGYREGYLRMSIVACPFSSRHNTGDNTPPVVHFDLVPGSDLRLTVVPKGGGSENMSCVRMLTPADGRRGVVDVVVGCVEKAGANPCPPIIVGVGIGGTMEYAALLAKRSLLRSVGQPSPDEDTADLERELLQRVNALGIGPAGLGGRHTALAVHVEAYPCHIASLPVAVNIQCHAARHASAVL
ncbi:MAG: fumarate hydratase [Anaerolineae bacterium]